MKITLPVSFLFLLFFQSISFAQSEAPITNYSVKWATAGYHHHWNPVKSSSSKHYLPSTTLNQTPIYPASYSWKQGIHDENVVVLNLTPSESHVIYVQEYITRLDVEAIHLDGANDNDYNGRIESLKISYDSNCDGSHDVVIMETSGQNSATLSAPWIAGNVTGGCGGYGIKFQVTDTDGEEYERMHYVKLVKPSNEFHYEENYGSTLTKWNATNMDPADAENILMIEGFDAKSILNPEKYIDELEGYLSCGFNVYILDFRHNAQEIKRNAALTKSAVLYVAGLNQSRKITLAGVSMGGLVARYALAEAEANGVPLPVKTFISFDSPHNGAVIDVDFQNWHYEVILHEGCVTWKSVKANNEFTIWGLDNPAAWQILKKHSVGLEPNSSLNTFSEGIGYASSDIHDEFQADIESLNTNGGFPYNTRNIGLSFSTNTSVQSANSIWFDITQNGISSCLAQEFQLNSDAYSAGSYLPKKTGKYRSIRGGGGWVNFNRNTASNSQPTFIPHTSSLDIRNSASAFDETVVPPTTSYHDEFPQSAAFKNTVVDKLDNADDWGLQNYIEAYSVEHRAKYALSAGSDVNNMRPQGNYIIAPSGNVTMHAGGAVTFMPGFDVMNGGQLLAEIVPIEGPECGSGKTDNLMSIVDDKFSRSDSDPSMNKNITVYPNPTNGLINVELKQLNGAVDIKLIGSLGNVIQYQKTDQIQTQFDLTMQPKGIYFIQVTSDSFSGTYRVINL